MENHLRKMEDQRGENIIGLLRGLCHIFAEKYSSEASSEEEDIQHVLMQKALKILLFEDPVATGIPESSDELISYMRGTVFNKRHSLGHIDDLINELAKHAKRLEALGSYGSVSRFLLCMSWRSKQEIRDNDSSDIKVPDLERRIFPPSPHFTSRPFTKSFAVASATSPSVPPSSTQPSSFFQSECPSPATLTRDDSDEVAPRTGSEYNVLAPNIESVVCPERCVTHEKLMSCIKTLMTGHESTCFRRGPNGFELESYIHTKDICRSALLSSCENFCLAGDAYEYLDKAINNKTYEELFESSLSKYLLQYAVSVTSVPSDISFLLFFSWMDGLSQQIRHVVKYISMARGGTQLLKMIFRGALESCRFSRGIFQLFLLEYCNSYFNMVDAWIFRGVCYPQFFVEQTVPDSDIHDRSTFLKAFILKAQNIPLFLPCDEIFECGRNVFLLRLIGNGEFSSLLQMYRDKPKLEVAIDEDEVSQLSKRWECFFEHYNCRFQPIFKENKFDLEPEEVESMRKESSRRIKLEKETEDKVKMLRKDHVRQLRYEDMKRWNQVITARAIEDRMVEMQAELEEKIRIVQENEKTQMLRQEVVQQYSKELEVAHKQHIRSVWKLKRDACDSIRVPFIGDGVANRRVRSSVPIHFTLENKSPGPLDDPAECTPQSTTAVDNIESSSPPSSAIVYPGETTQPMHSSRDISEIPNKPEETALKKNVFVVMSSPPKEPSASSSDCAPDAPPPPVNTSSIPSESIFRVKLRQVTSPSAVVSSLFSSVTRPLQVHSEYIQWALSKVFLEEMQIYNDFKMIKDYMFLGLFGDMFTDSACRLFENDTQPVIFMKAMHAILEKTSCPRLSCVYEGSDAGTVDLSKFKLTYLTNWPLNLILTEECVNKYTVVFEICWFLNRATWHLDDCRRKLAMQPSVKGNQLLQVNIHMHTMRTFICAIKSYLSFVFENAWTALMTELTTVRSFDRLYQVHVKYIKQILFNALLNKNAFKLSKEISDALHTILRYCRIARLESEWMITGGQFRHSKFSKLKKLYSGFLEVVNYIEQFVTKVSKRAVYEQLCLLRELISPLN